MGLVVGIISGVVATIFFRDSWVFWLLWIFGCMSIIGWWHGECRHAITDRPEIGD